ncbi:GNAT family N-acetyltransferase [Vulcanisaeta distributa]|uniref:GCN5-related N-acetyltransferase n=1 Tax=Vulcanisaeta distributa (strain DSM 14429 / JCM 11212 / NBRC 100878 / IC-017) TaxID=572478 RepID=E1QP56_VULDI|nr:GNAT family N-acetyltransferase [Vulcanisaeta distributa]ADN50227.1 GCN5-related N-acetyltransferase [Vulcanisaeta distributa DSM 14429]
MVTIREARESDVDALVDLVVRLKRLNSEFDPLFSARNDCAERAREYLINALRDNKNHLVLVAEDMGKIVGVLKADIRERLFYSPSIEGAIVDFYVMPEYRRKGLGRMMLERAIAMLRERGAQLITAEFPTQNQIAVNFYNKMGFRSLVSIYARET